MSGIKPLRQVKLGKQPSTAAVATTTVWHGNALAEDTRVQRFIGADVGIMSGTDDTYVPKLGAAILVEATPATFEQLPHLLEMNIKKVTTGVADGGGSGKVYTYAFPTTAVPTLGYYTIETGDNQEAEEVDYCFGTDLTLTGDEGEAWTMGSSLIGRQVTVSSFTTTATLPSVEVILFQKTKLYIDAIGGSFGSTLKSNTLLAAQFTYRNGARAKFTADGNLYFSFVQPTMPEARLRLTFEHDTTGTAEKVNWRAQTARKIRLLSQGSALTTAGTYSTKTLIIDLCGKWEKFNKIGERNGNDILEGEFVGKYSSTAGDFGKVLVVNLVTALP
jgi:hypothetical protein